MKRTVSKRLVLFFLSLNLLGVTLSSIFAQPEVVKIAALRGPTGLGMVKLFQDKPLLKGTVKTEYFSYPSPDVLLPRLLNGEVQIAALPTNVAVNLYNRKIPYVLAAVIGNGVLYGVSTDPALTQLEKVERLQNVGKGSTPEFILRHILQSRGLEEKVRVEYRFAPMELAQVLIAGRESTGILPEPFVTKVLRARKDARIISDLQEEWKTLYPETPTYPMSVLVVHSNFLHSSLPLVETFLDLYKQSQDWVKNNPEAAGEIASKLSFGLDREDAKDAIPRCNLTFVTAREARSSLEKFLKVLLQFAPESIGGKLPDSAFYAFP
ncbi:MAG: ABC transporter substrate-binding protein [Spirochaetales bacterium]